MKRIGVALAICLAACAVPAATTEQSSPAPAEAPAPKPAQHLEGPVPTPMPQGQRPFLGSEDPDACGASRFQHLIGQSEAAARAANLPQPFRILCHNCPATTDYVSNRLNVTLDPQGRVAQVTCG